MNKKITKFDPNLICPLCGINSVQHNGKKYISCEHILPKSVFFDREDRDGLITVPSCYSCNNGTSGQDEIFKCFLSTILLGVDTPQKRELFKSCKKTFDKKPNWRANIIKSVSPLLVLYGQGYGHPVYVDMEPIERVIVKIIRGLYWKVTGMVADSGASVTIKYIEQGRSLDGELLHMFQTFGKCIQKCKNQFEAIFVIENMSSSSSAWLIRFYSQDFCLVFLKEQSISPHDHYQLET